MKNFYEGGRGLHVLEWLSHLFKSKNNRSRTLYFRCFDSQNIQQKKRDLRKIIPIQVPLISQVPVKYCSSTDVVLSEKYLTGTRRVLYGYLKGTEIGSPFFVKIRDFAHGFFDYCSGAVRLASSWTRRTVEQASKEVRTSVEAYPKNLRRNGYPKNLLHSLQFLIFQRSTVVCLLLIVLTVLLFSNQLQAQEPRKDSGANGHAVRTVYGINGRVKNALTLLPMEAVQVVDVMSGKETYTDQNGYFELQGLSEIVGKIRLSLYGYVSTKKEYEIDTLAIDGRADIVFLDVDVSGIPEVVLGDSLPPLFWQLPIPVYNHASGRTNITLAEYRDRPFVLLKFWSVACGPCIRAMEYFNQIRQEEKIDIPLLSVYVDSPDRIQDFLKARDWGFPVLYGEQTRLLNAFFYRVRQYGGLLILKDGRLYGMPYTEDLNAVMLRKLLAGEDVKLRSKINGTEHDKKRKGGKI
ncbi:redoxin domain-containing protein [Sphingobacterium sp. LRF_L2]|uniref:redoxin domain-containing protein n=1 Tax=Sphingobacterium sp. LRF_L2 TaxID=3369421 RepID=UPI003F639399